MNYCSVVQLTQCQVSVMTSALPEEKYATPTAETAAGVETSMSMPMNSTTTTSQEVMTEPVPTQTAAPATTSAPMTAAAQHVKALPGAAWAAAIMAVLCLL